MDKFNLLSNDSSKSPNINSLQTNVNLQNKPEFNFDVPLISLEDMKMRTIHNNEIKCDIKNFSDQNMQEIQNPMQNFFPILSEPIKEMENISKKFEDFDNSSIVNSFDLTESTGLKRKTDLDNDGGPDTKKSSTSSEEKKIVNLRKNIRDVMDENQLDANTLVAQREESERLARVAEQQKIIREYQRQTAVNRQHVRTQNRVLSLLQGSNTIAKITDLTDDNSLDGIASSSPKTVDIGKSLPKQISLLDDGTNQSFPDGPKEEIICEESQDEAIPVKHGDQDLSNDVVTIEDSSSEDDCILLSDDEEEEDFTEEENEDPHNSGLHVKDAYNVPDELGRVVVNVGHPEGEEEVFLAPQIARIIKPHQIGGVRFLFDNIVESIKRFKNSSGFGCILAHSMGLGKTLQVVCFCDIFLRHTLSKTVLCVMPINTIQNWLAEFNMWTPLVSDDEEKVRPRKFEVFVLNDQQKTLTARAKVILKWAEEGGVLLIGYELFRLLALKIMSTRKRRSKKSHLLNTESESNKKLMDSVYEALVKPGPDLVICDEGHRIKNANAGISLALKQIRTRRRIVLTGYPLQNNLLEYWCMVDFVRPNYLGTRTEFCNMFERPIQNGQCIDSTPEDIKLMRFRAHVLHSLLLGFVQRRSHFVLQQTLPQKSEYVILTRMTSFQRKLYETFMNDVVRSKTIPNPLKAFAVCCKIWNHPDVLYNFLKKRETDLDLEIEDGEVVAERPNSVASTEKLLEPKPVEKSENIVDELKPSIVPDASQSVPQKEMVKLDQFNTSLNCRETGNFNNTNTNKCSNQFQSNYTEGFPQQSIMPYSSDFNATNYWMENNVPYFMCQPTPKPDYLGIMEKNNAEKLPNDFDNMRSSEIVDLDTQEIKTVKTNINITQNAVLRNEINEKNKGLQSTSLMGSKLPVTDQSKDMKPISASNMERDHSKLKSDDGIPYEWAHELMRKYEAGLISTSPKMEIFFCILNESILLGDKVLLFSQSLLTLNLMENFLQSNYIPTSNIFWKRNESYYRLDGSTSSQDRERLVNEFNSNGQIKLFLISTRAGSLGINLIGANRVIIFDASWNPCHDTQAIYRIYRYGQKKACCVYRIVMDKCLEKKIYDRQIKKQGMSDRVVDECNPDAHLSMKDVTNLCHDFDECSTKDDNEFSQPVESYLDTIIQKIVQQYKTCLSKEPFHHESLLIDRKEKKLSQAEKRQAHRGYQLEKKAALKQNTICTTNKFQYRVVRTDGTVITRPVASIRPMPTIRSLAVTKTQGIRSTKWIPAEVWQRQGMTAQEMTLPLDVVIPTSSSDKANIILNAGQRVMVLKSSKGIYMQLDSGKIIAIRTSNKTNETIKSEKEEVIDITSENENVMDVSETDKKNPVSSDGASNIESESEKKQFKTDSLDGKLNEISRSPQKLKNNTSVVGACSTTTTQLKPALPIQDNLPKSAPLNSRFPEPQSTKLKLDNYTKNEIEPMKNTILQIPNVPKPISPVINQPIQSEIIPTDNNKKELPYEANKNTKKIFPNFDYQNSSMINNGTTQRLNHPVIETQPKYDSSVKLPCVNDEQSLSSINSEKMNKLTPTVQVQPMSNSVYNMNGIDSNKFSMPSLQKEDIAFTANSFQNVNDKREEKKIPTEFSTFKHNQNNVMNQNSQYVTYDQTQQYSRQQPYKQNTQVRNMMNSSSGTNSEIGLENNLQQNSVLQRTHYQQYYDNIYDHNITTPYEYSPQYSDYSIYGCYNHPRYQSNIHSNLYGNSPATTMGTNSFHMHWSPYMNHSSINDQCNNIYPPTNPQNGTQPNQWQHQ